MPIEIAVIVKHMASPVDGNSLIVDIRLSGIKNCVILLRSNNV